MRKRPAAKPPTDWCFAFDFDAVPSPADRELLRRLGELPGARVILRGEETRIVVPDRHAKRLAGMLPADAEFCDEKSRQLLGVGQPELAL